MANLELSKHGGAHPTRGGDAEKTEASFVRLDYATEDKETQKNKFKCHIKDYYLN